MGHIEPPDASVIVVDGGNLQPKESMVQRLRVENEFSQVLLIQEAPFNCLFQNPDVSVMISDVSRRSWLFVA